MFFRFATLVLLLIQLPFIIATSKITTTVKIVKSADGTPIYSDATGDPSKPSIIFVHGFALSGVVFDDLFTNQKLLDNFYLVRYDMRGHGRSGKPATAAAHVSARYADDFTAVSKGFNLKNPVFVGWSLASAIITDIVANINPIPIAGAVALSGSPGIDADIIPLIGSPTLLGVLPEFNGNTNVTLALTARVQFVNALFDDLSSVPFSLISTYLGQTVVQNPDVSVLVSMRPQDPTKLFAAGDAGKLEMQVLAGTSDQLVVSSGVISVFKPHFKDLTINLIPGGHALFHDNQAGMVDALTPFALRVIAKCNQK